MMCGTRGWVALVTLSLLAGCHHAGQGSTPQVGASESEAGAEGDEGGRRLVGLAAFTAKMLRRGAGERTTADIAEQIEEVGGDLDIETDADDVAVEVRVLREHLGLALDLLADMAQRPTFPADEVERLRSQELDRLSLMRSNPRWVANETFYRQLYGPNHPYGHRDAEIEGLQHLTRQDLVGFHQRYYVPRNAFLVVVGDVDASEVNRLASERFASWPDAPAPSRDIPPPPTRSRREVVVVDMPHTTQAQIAIGNVSLRRAAPEYIPLRVANQVLGGSASARLFMNLRERCSYSYGIYSRIDSQYAPGAFLAGGAFEVSHTAGALREIFAELDRIVSEPAGAAELEAARQYLVGHFPIITETAGNLAYLVMLQRVLELPADYWSTYRSNIAAVSGDAALDAARRFIEPDRALVVIAGDASQVADPARRWGPVTVMDVDGHELRHLEEAPGQWPGGEPPPCPDMPARSETHEASPPAPAQPRDFEFPAPREDVLDNGLTVLTIERHRLPLVYLRLVVLAGSAADPL